MKIDKQSLYVSRAVVACILAGTLLSAHHPAAGAPAGGAVRTPTVSPADWANQPLAFEENRGQAPMNFQFVARSSSFELATNSTGAIMRTPDTTVGMDLAGANPRSTAYGISRLPGTVNYLLGDEPGNFRTDIPTFERVRYREVYRGIDVVYYGNQRNLEYDFIAAPHADLDMLRLKFSGIEKFEIAHNGDLILRTATGELRQHKPVAYQERNGVRESIPARYRVIGNAEVTFELGVYDRNRPLVIDPVMTYSTYLGGVGEERGNGIAVDGQGNTYVVGQTNLGGPTLHAFVRKFNAAGAAVYTSFVGNGQCDSKGNAISVDVQGNAIITGTYVFFDQWGYCNMGGVLASKFNPAGNGFVYNQYVGGSGEKESGNAITVDAQGNAYITGRIFGTLPTTPGAFQFDGQGWDDAFVLKLNSAGAIVYATYVGGSWMDEGVSIAVDATGKVTVGGSTGSSNFPVSANGFLKTWPNTSVAGFVTQLNASGTQVVYSTYLGGSRADTVAGVALDATGKIYVTGTTSSDNFPTTINAFDRTCGSDGYCNPHYVDYSMHYAEDAFVARIDPASSGAASLTYSSFFGGLNRELARAIAVDSTGRVYVAGRTQSLADFPLVAPIQSELSGGDDGFISQFDLTRAGANSLVFSTFFGGAQYDEIQGMALDPAQSVFVTGYTESADFPIRNADQAVNGGGSDAFVAKIAAGTAPLIVSSVAINPASVTGGAGATGTVTLSGPAPAGSIVISLSSGNAAALVPASVNVPAGATSASFNITSTAVSTTITATISASLSGTTKTAQLTVNPPVLVGVSLTPTSVNGGVNSTGTVTLGSVAPVAGMTIVLATNNIAATVPSTVKVPAGATTANFAITTKAVTSSTPVLISALFGNVTKTATLSVNPSAISLVSVAVNPATVAGGAVASGTVSLTAAAVTGGAIVTLTSSNTGVATVPVSVTVPAGATTAAFSIATKPLTSAASVTVSAVRNNVTKTASLTVRPSSATLTTVTFSPASVIGGTSSTGIITLSEPAPAGGAIVNLASNNTTAVTVPASAVVAAGTTSKSFVVTTRGIAATTSVGLTASYSGVTRTAVLSVMPAALAGVTVAPSNLGGGATASGTVSLTGSAPVSGAIVLLSSSNPAVQVPLQVKVASGTKTIAFAVTTTSVTAVTPVVVSAAYAGLTKTAAITVRPIALSSINVPATIKGGATINGSVVLNAAAPMGGVMVALSSKNPAVASVPASISVPAGATTAAFTITTRTQTASTAVTISAAFNGVTKAGTITANP